MVTGIRRNVNLGRFTTLRAGGPADEFLEVASGDELADAALFAQQQGCPLFILGSGSNVLPADAGVPGLVVCNNANQIKVQPNGELFAESGALIQDVFLKAAQMGLRGLEFAVGIPGTLGGALVSNAGAYRSNVSEFLTEIEIVFDGRRQWVGPDWMQFSYRDSRLRREDAPSCAIVHIKLRLPEGDPKSIYDEARDYQRQRIGKQPPPASAGSFFKNVTNKKLAQTMNGLTEGMRKAGVIPAGFLIEAVGMKGHRHGGCMLSSRHANFMLNVGGATATEIFELAQMAKKRVSEKFGVILEEEVLYLGRWNQARREN